MLGWPDTGSAVAGGGTNADGASPGSGKIGVARGLGAGSANGRNSSAMGADGP